MSDSKDVERLIGLKRHENPGDEYFRNFCEDFKERQRSEMLSQSSVALFRERFGEWTVGLGHARWAVPLGAAAAVAGSVFLVAEQKASSDVEVPIVENQRPDSEKDAIEKSSVIRLKLPRPEGTKAPEVQSGGDRVLPASWQVRYREL